MAMAESLGTPEPLEPLEGDLLPVNEDEFDTFNSDTFGDTEEWDEGTNEQLASLNEQERKALKESNDFFGFGEDDYDDESLEPLEPSENKNGNSQQQQQQLRHLEQEFERKVQFPPPPQLPTQQQQQDVLRPQGPPPQVVQQQQQQFQDPAIMSVGNMPVIHVHPHPNFQQQQQQRHQPQMQFNPQQFPPLNFDPRQQHRFPPPPMMPQLPPGMRYPMMPPPPGHHSSGPHVKTLEELERGMMFPPESPQKMNYQEQQQHRQQFHNQQQQSFHQHQQQRHHNQHYQQQQQQMQYRGRQNYQNNNNRNRNQYDDKNGETFGDDFVEDNFRHDNRQHQHHHHSQDQDRWQSRGPRSNYLQNLTPGHVHALGVLRGAKLQRQPEIVSTGNPQLDLEIERREEHAESWQREYYERSSDDAYAGLMTPKERQWIINIQLQQLKCENPFLDDYYYTVYNQKKQMAEAEEADEAGEEEGTQLKRDEEGPQLLLQSAADIAGKEHEYQPTQFSNSLGKLQAITVKAPRRIIDINALKEDSFDGIGPTSAQKELRNYKSTLMEIERLYGAIIEAEDCEKKIAALPTNTELRMQFEDERSSAVHQFCATLTTENKIKRYLMVRKGKTLLKRGLRMLDNESLQLLCSKLFQLFPAVMRRDREDKLIQTFWPELKCHVGVAPFELVVHYLSFLNSGGLTTTTTKQSLSTFKRVLSHSLGTSIVLALLGQLNRLHGNLSDNEKNEAKKVVNELLKTVHDLPTLAAPLEKVQLNPIKGILEGDAFTKLQKFGLMQDTS